MTAEITCLLDGRFALAECPTWDERRQKLFFTDIKGKAIHALDWKNRELETWTFAKEVGSFALCEDGRLIVAVWDQVVLFDPQSGAQQAIASIEADNPHTRLNDGKAGPDGAFWVGTMDNRSPRQPVAGLYRVAPDGKVTQILDGVHVSNGLAWSPDGRAMYHADSSPGWVDRWRFDPAAGAVSERTRFAQLTNETGRPDGATVDSSGNYWSAGVSAGVLNCFSPSGALLAKFTLPVPRPTMPCFCGPELADLVITSLRPDDAASIEAAPQSGSLFHLRPGLTGLPSYRFGAKG
ncbi:Gluconolactonase precursor [Pannonibacter phragmitetus]|uniref:Gluconolactonase n=1 Tax=Pannonibacter phragmitetus TaxID=121719 RepID=A0A378ZY66_9HYPH|nr:SMP-30/gluconolactonase/LRE family protein [Pannonibacter phragmitetus]SUB01780.1 Gluconolactonase precursor [Pannonibacter phragmitetus]